MSDTAQVKGRLRRALRERIRAVPSETRSRALARIEPEIWSIPEVARARVLLVYAALPGELSMEGVAGEARARGITVVYPRCVEPERRMTLHPVAAEGALVPGSHGIREPVPGCPSVSAAEVDVALVPALGWDRSGTRLGRGAGYYDRLFAEPDWRAFRCGVYLALQEVAEIPREPWDAPLDAVLTERELIRPRSGRPPTP